MMAAKIKVGAADGTYADDNFHPFQCGSDRQEQSFARVRTLTHDRSVDMSRLANRMSCAAQLDDVYERRPPLDRGSRRLRASSDHINVRSTTGSRSVSKLSLSEIWKDGRSEAIVALARHSGYDIAEVEATFANAETEPGVTLLKPKGHHVGVTLTASEIRDAAGDDREVNPNSLRRAMCGIISHPLTLALLTALHSRSATTTMAVGKLKQMLR